LAVQDGRVCSIETDTMGTYTLRATLANETVLFLERPDRRAAKISTQAFVESFGELFKSSSPNVAITFTGDASLDGPLIVVLSRPRIIGGLDEGSSTLGVEYTMEQSESQSTVAAIEQFLEASGSCSVFIDGMPFNACRVNIAMTQLMPCNTCTAETCSTSTASSICKDCDGMPFYECVDFNTCPCNTDTCTGFCTPTPSMCPTNEVLSIPPYQ
jgi:hypothetical protein